MVPCYCFLKYQNYFPNLKFFRCLHFIGIFIYLEMGCEITIEPK